LKQIALYISTYSIIFLLGSCSPKGLLTDPLLSSQSFKGNKTLTKEQLEALLPQRPNKKLPIIPITPGLYFYQLFSAKLPPLVFNSYAEKKIEWKNDLTKLNEEFDQTVKGMEINSPIYLKLLTKKENKVGKINRKINEGNWAMRTFGEQPSYFYEDDAIKNVEKVKTYLKNHGFFRYNVSYKKDTTFFNKNGVSITYIVDEGTIYPLKQTDSLVVEDRVIREILSANQAESHLKVGDRLVLDNINDEKSRIEQLLKNNGYYNFTKDNISIPINDLDTAITKGISSVIFIPNPRRPPINQNYRKSYTINKVTFVSDGSSSSISSSKVDTVYNNNIQYIFVNKRFSTKLLDTKIGIRPYQLYRLQNRQQTEKNLYGLDQFQFTRITFDTTKGLLDATIYAKPLDKYQFTAETGGSVFQSVFGPFLNLSLKARNLGGSASSLETNFRFGFEAQTGFFDTESINRNLEFGFTPSLIIPKILAPDRISNRFNTFTPLTRLSIGAEYINRQEYSRLNFKISGSYLWRPSPNKYWQVSLIDLNLLNTENQSVKFVEYLDSLKSKGNNLGQSFNKSFVSSINASYTYTDNPYGQVKRGNYLKVLFESGGTTLNFIPEGKIGFISNLFGNNLQFYKFLRINADYRKYLTIGQSKSSSFAYRVNFGVAYSYGEGRNLPYEKNFFVGGPSSLRAWQPRNLGPGSYAITQKLDKPGSVLLESSAEFRFKIIRFLGDYNINGAFFVDAGNVWRIQNQNTEGALGSDFQFDRFYKEIAVGTGFGVRFDLSFFVIRLDAAVKVIDPLQNEGNRWVLFRDYGNFRGPKLGGFTNPLVFNFGIGYPF
jgi:outer membrane protein assembly factor BamA